MADDRQGKFELIKGGAGEVKPPPSLRSMPKWQWALLWAGSVLLWLLLFYYFLDDDLKHIDRLSREKRVLGVF